MTSVPGTSFLSKNAGATSLNADLTVGAISTVDAGNVAILAIFLPQRSGRIAAAISAGWSGLTMDESWEDGLLVLADAVIRELGLREERRGPVTAYRDGQYYPDSSLVRFISDWETRDD